MQESKGDQAMRRKGLGGTIFAAILVITLAVALAATWFITKNYVVVNWRLYPKGQEVLDLQKQSLSPQEYDALCWNLPYSQILWSVPFQNQYISSEAEEITISSLSVSDIPQLMYLSKLKTVDAEGCTDYAALAALKTQMPALDVRYRVPVSGTEYSSDATSVTVTTLSEADVENLNYLPKLKTVNASQCRDFETLQQLKQAHPQWNIDYTTSIAGTPIDPAAKKLDLTGASYDELSIGLAAMPGLTSLFIHAPQANSEELTLLREEYPDVDIHWDMEIFGNTFSDDATEVDISNEPIGSIENAKAIASKFPKLEKLIVNSDGIPHEDMADYREEVRSQYKVVWFIKFSAIVTSRTDDTWFMPTKLHEYYFLEQYTPNLKYMEDLVCIDLGHHPIHQIEFTAYMPHLKYLILAWTEVTDISPLVNCKELVYLEIDHTIVADYTPLLQCPALEDININDQMVTVDITPLTQMTWLKNLWCPTSNYRDKMRLVEALPDTRVVTTEISSATGQGWRNLKNYYDMRDFLGMPYMD